MKNFGRKYGHGKTVYYRMSPELLEKFEKELDRQHKDLTQQDFITCLLETGLALLQAGHDERKKKLLGGSKKTTQEFLLEWVEVGLELLKEEKKRRTNG